MKINLINWEQIPDFGIYNEQLLYIINNQPYLLEDPISSSMVNNYVKKKYLEKPIKKKYYRKQVALLILINIFKGVLNMEDLKYALDILTKKYGLEDTYKNFQNSFFGEKVQDNLIDSMVNLIYSKNKIKKIIEEEIIEEKRGDYGDEEI